MRKIPFRRVFSKVSTGCALMALGCVLLVVGYPTHLNDSNLFLLFALGVILLGAVVLVAAVRRKSRY